MEYIAIDNKTALHKIKNSRLPYHYDLNIYRGCQHGCKYCYAIYSHDYLQNGKFFDTVYYKKNILETLEKELSSKSWKCDVVNIGGVTDSYQPIEKELEIMRDVLKLMIKYKTPIIILTKSDLILRDLDLIKELSEITYVNIAFTITIMNEDIRQKIEPNGSPAIKRLEALKQFKEKTNANIGLHLSPIIPFITDNNENLGQIIKYAGEIQVNYLLPGVLYLKGKTKPYFMDFIKEYDQKIYLKINKLLNTPLLKKQYKENLYQRIHYFMDKYKVSSNYMKDIPKEIE